MRIPRKLRKGLARAVAVAFLAAVVAFLAMLPAPPASAASEAIKSAPREYLLKSVFIYRLAKFVEWPTNQRGVLRLCVFGADPFRGALDAIEGRMVNDQQVVIVWPEDVSAAQTCDILFVSQSEVGKIGSILEGVAGKAVLTISDIPDFGRAGGVVALKTEANRLKFQINMTAARSAGLVFGSQALELAEILEPSGLAGQDKP